MLSAHFHNWNAPGGNLATIGKGILGTRWGNLATIGRGILGTRWGNLAIIGRGILGTRWGNLARKSSCGDFIAKL